MDKILFSFKLFNQTICNNLNDLNGDLANERHHQGNLFLDLSLALQCYLRKS
jgi:hypothetical protein